MVDSTLSGPGGFGRPGKGRAVSSWRPGKGRPSRPRLGQAVAVAETAEGSRGGRSGTRAWRISDGGVTDESLRSDLVTEMPRTSLFLASSSDVPITRRGL